MGWFSRLRTPSEAPELHLLRTVERLAGEVEELRAEVRRLRAEWVAELTGLSDLQGKLAAWVGRLAARERKKASAQIDQAGTEQSSEGNGGVAEPPSPRSFSKAQLRELAAKLRRGAT